MTELALVARALFYALLIHLVASPWTAQIVRDVDGGDDWTKHLSALVLYAVVVLLVTPVILGVTLNWWLRRAEKRGTLGLRHSGARDARDAFDYAFSKSDIRGFYVIVRIKGRDLPVAGTLGTDSWAGMAPEPHDLYLEEVRSMTPDGGVGPPIQPQHGLWIAAESIEAVFVVQPPEAVRSENGEPTATPPE